MSEFKWLCQPFDSRSIQKPDCKRKIASGNYMKCQDCKGKGLVIISRESDDMANSKCIIKGCAKNAKVKGYCCTHAKENEPIAYRRYLDMSKSYNPSKIDMNKPIISLQPIVDEVEVVPVAEPRVDNIEQAVAMVLQSIREREQEKLDIKMMQLSHILSGIGQAQDLDSILQRLM